jgi:hypothetical protein
MSTLSSSGRLRADPCLNQTFNMMCMQGVCAVWRAQLRKLKYSWGTSQENIFDEASLVDLAHLLKNYNWHIQFVTHIPPLLECENVDIVQGSLDANKDKRANSLEGVGYGDSARSVL